MLRDFAELPRSAQHLIIYYTIAMLDGLDFFVTIYMFALGFGVIDVGLLFSYLMLLTAILKVLIGRLIDRFLPPKHLMIIMELLFAVYWLILGFAKTLIEFLLAFSISAVTAIFRVAYRSIERDLYPQDKLDIAYKHHMFWPYFMQFIITPIYGFILDLDFIAMFKLLAILTAGFCLSRGLYIAIFIPKTKPKIESIKRSIIKDLLSLPRSLVLIMIAEIIIFISFDIAPFFVIENYLYNIMGVGPLGVSLIYSLGGLLGAIGVLIYDKLKKISSEKLLYIAIIMESGGSLVLFSTQYTKDKFLIILIAMCLIYISWVIWFTIHEIIVMSRIPENLRGTIFGFLSATKIIISIPLPTLAALLVDMNPLIPYLLQAILFISTIPLYKIALSIIPKKHRD